jgi:predicted GIY-YIG superfamily endonuclease
MFVAYILQNPAGKFYVGQTADLDARLESHNALGATEGKFTRKHGPWGLVYREVYATRSEAMARESGS